MLLDRLLVESVDLRRVRVAAVGPRFGPRLPGIGSTARFERPWPTRWPGTAQALASKPAAAAEAGAI